MEIENSESAIEVPVLGLNKRKLLINAALAAVAVGVMLVVNQSLKAGRESASDSDTTTTE